MKKMTVQAYQKSDLLEMIAVWNEVVEDGMAFPQEEKLTEQTGSDFFAQQDFVGVVRIDSVVAGLFILHPNNVGRCGHHANASYAVRSDYRGHGIGACLVKHSLEQARVLGYRLLVFNAVVKGNDAAVRLYEKLGFVKVGEIPQGFRLKNGVYQNTMIFYHTL